MRLREVTRFALLLVPLVVCASRLHAQRTATPVVLLQEANRCLSLARASSRRRQSSEMIERTGRHAQGAGGRQAGGVEPRQARVAAYSS